MSVNEKMTAIADAIRAKTGGTELLGLDAMAEAIAAITGGSIGENKYEVISGSFVPATDVKEEYRINTGLLDPDGTYVNDCFYMVFADSDVSSTMYGYELILGLLFYNVGNTKYSTGRYTERRLTYRASNSTDSPTTSTSADYFYTVRNNLNGAGGEIQIAIECTQWRAVLKAGRRYTWVVIKRELDV